MKTNPIQQISDRLDRAFSDGIQLFDRSPLFKAVVYFTAAVVLVSVTLRAAIG
ncbi:MAG: hypothetical protein R3221_12690 [Spongiibacter sp.]|nr:hypothetical protein [Spongiibacter sp.]